MNLRYRSAFTKGLDSIIALGELWQLELDNIRLKQLRAAHSAALQ